MPLLVPVVFLHLLIRTSGFFGPHLLSQIKLVPPGAFCSISVALTEPLSTQATLNPLPITHLVVVEGPSLVWLTCDLVERDHMVTVSRDIVFDDARNGNDLDGNGRDDDDDMGDVVAAAGPRVTVISPPVTRTAGLPRSRGGAQNLPTTANCDTPTNPPAIEQQRPIDQPGDDEDGITGITRAAPSGRLTTFQHARATVVTPRHASERIAPLLEQEETEWNLVTPRPRGRRRRMVEERGPTNPLLAPLGRHDWVGAAMLTGASNSTTIRTAFVPDTTTECPPSRELRQFVGDELKQICVWGSACTITDM
jgi:hypothetical protein